MPETRERDLDREQWLQWQRERDRIQQRQRLSTYDWLRAYLDAPLIPPSAVPGMPSQIVARPPAKEPSTVAIAEPEVIDAAYATLAGELGLQTAAIDRERFKAYVHDAGLRVYDRAEVQEYLHAKYGVPPGNITAHVVWGWRPLRAVDQRTVGTGQSANGVIQYGAPLYAKPIPYPVLLTIKAVRDAAPSAHFYVSDDFNRERIPDPFLLVEVGEEQFVIERWDEPSFRGTR
jgi:hypothetical protein